MTITQAEIDDLRRKAEEAIRLEVASSEHDEEWCAKHHNLRCYANPQRIKRLLDELQAQAERIETLEGALSSAHERLYNHDLCLCESESSEICDAAHVLGKKEEGTNA